MTPRHNPSIVSPAKAAEGILNAAIHSQMHITPGHPDEPARPFVTVSRQPGAGGIPFSHRLAERLNGIDGGDWWAWDQELIEKVSSEYHIERSILEMLEVRPHSWLDDLLVNFSSADTTPDVLELRAYKRVMMAFRALAEAGHAIIVGRGGVFVTGQMPGGIHLRLVAPIEHRIRYVSVAGKISLSEAAARIESIDRNRDSFYAHYWPGKSIAPETFMLTLNSAALSVDEMVECALPL